MTRRRPHSRRSRYRRRYDDPEGTRYGIPTYPWRLAPAGLLTRRQLAARGLRPGGQDPVAQIMWRRYRRDAVAYLYRLDLAKPKRPMTPAKWAAVRKAVAARSFCPTCQTQYDHVLSTRLGQCTDCAEQRRYAA